MFLKGVKKHCFWNKNAKNTCFDTMLQYQQRMQNTCFQGFPGCLEVPQSIMISSTSWCPSWVACSWEVPSHETIILRDDTTTGALHWMAGVLFRQCSYTIGA